jgi:hypothetical protein
MIATSSAEVSTLVKSSGFEVIARSSEPASSPALKHAIRTPPKSRQARSSSPRRRPSQIACLTCAFSIMNRSSPARYNGIVVTAIAPALSTANQHAASIAVLGARSKTRFPGSTPRSSTSTFAIWFAVPSSRAYVQAPSPGRTMQRLSPAPSATRRSRKYAAALIRSGYRRPAASKISPGLSCAKGSRSAANVSTCPV